MIAAVLAGGRGRRMGGGKALAPLGGRPLIAWPLAAAREAGLEPVVVAKRGSALPELDVAVWHEPDEPAHPLCGLVCALERAGGPVVAVACDQPFVTGEALRALAAAGGELALAREEEPFPARYDPVVLPALRDALRREAALRSVLTGLVPVTIGLPEATVASVNTPAELAAAEAVLGARH